MVIKQKIDSNISLLKLKLILGSKYNVECAAEDDGGCIYWSISHVDGPTIIRHIFNDNISSNYINITFNCINNPNMVTLFRDVYNIGGYTPNDDDDYIIGEDDHISYEKIGDNIEEILDNLFYGTDIINQIKMVIDVK
jgi:hypothetical protein